MSTVYDDDGEGVPEPTCAEQDAFCDIHAKIMNATVQRFGHERAAVILDWWHVSVVAEALTNGWERSRRRRILDDLNEEIRSQIEQEGDDHPTYWVLIPTKEP